MTLIRVAGPAVEPVELADAKVYHHVEYDVEDDQITRVIKAAREEVEKRTGRVLVTQTWEVRDDCFDDAIPIPLVPAQSVSSVTYYDDTGVLQTLDPSTYTMVDGGDAEMATLIPLVPWPMNLYRRPDAVRIQFVAGYAPDDADLIANIPDGLIQCIYWLVGHFLDNRESVVLTPTRQQFQEVPDTVETILAPFIVPRL